MKVFGRNSILDHSQMLMAHIKGANRRHRQDDVNIHTPPFPFASMNKYVRYVFREKIFAKYITST